MEADRFAAAKFEDRDDGLVDIKGVELLAVGKFTAMDGQKVNVTDAMLKTIAENAKTLASEVSPALKLGHVDKLADGTEAPRFGSVANVRVKGKKLFADFMAVPKRIAKLMKKGAYPSRSVEVLHKFTNAAGKVFKNVLEAVALLGARRPAVSTLADVAKLFSSVDLGDDRIALEYPSIELPKEWGDLARYGALADKVEEDEARDRLNRMTWAAQSIISDIVRGEGDFEDFDLDEKKEAIAEVLDDLDAEVQKLVKASADDDATVTIEEETAGEEESAENESAEDEQSRSEEIETEQGDTVMTKEKESQLADVEKERDDAITEAASEKTRADTAEKKVAESDASARLADARTEATKFFDALEGKILPAEREIAEPMMVASLATTADDEKMRFSVGETGKEEIVSVADGIRKLFATREAIDPMLFKTCFEASDISKGSPKTAFEQLKAKADELVEKDKISFAAALKKVRFAEPDLVKQYNSERRETSNSGE